MCVMSHSVRSWCGDRSLTVSITMMEVAMKTGWERGMTQIYQYKRGGGVSLHKSLSSECAGGCLCPRHEHAHTQLSH